MRTQTIHLRASIEHKTLIDRAAKRLGKSRTEFMLDTMREASERVLLDQRLFNVDEAVFGSLEAVLSGSETEPPGSMREPPSFD